MALNADIILQVRGLTKSFSGVKALDNVQLDIYKGEVHALMGENGAGKSTLMKILMGMIAPDEGEVLYEGSPLTHTSVHEHLAKGITMIHQEIMAVPTLTVAQNIYLGRETKSGFWRWLDDSSLNQATEKLLQQLGISIPPTAYLKHLSVAEQQMVEIAKAVSQQAKVVIMDEPTSALSDNEVNTLFEIIRSLKKQGVAIIYISHKMDEIAQIADRVTVLRDGQHVATQLAHQLSTDDLILMMVGRSIETLYPPATNEKGEVVLSVQNLTRKGKFRNINFELHAGEVLGMAGLMGAGRTEIARAIYGLEPADGGEIEINGVRVQIDSPQKAIEQGIGYVSEDRKDWGIIPKLSVKDNLSLSHLRALSRNGWIKNVPEIQTVQEMATQLRIKSNDLRQAVAYLSGGNQQKVVLGRVLMVSPNVIILDEPTRGVDIGAKFEIYQLIRRLTAQGIAILMISSELPEILGMSDRILVLSKGRQAALLTQKEATQEKIMQYAVH